MTYVGSVNEALSKVVAQLLQHPEWISLVKQARDESQRFCLWPIYSDLVAFCKLVEARLAGLPASVAIDELVESLQSLYKAVATMVVARCGGETTNGNAFGFSIYLPSHTVENAYYSSLFAEYSSWPHLLTELCR